MDKYMLTKEEIQKVKKIAKVISYDWKTICARPNFAKDLIQKYDSGNLN